MEEIEDLEFRRSYPFSGRAINTQGLLGCCGPCYKHSEIIPIWMELLEEISDKYNVDLEEILVGYSDVPPSSPEYLVYVQLTKSGYEEFFRKNRSPYGRWVCWNRLLNERGLPGQKGTYDLRKGVLYV